MKNRLLETDLENLTIHSCVKEFPFEDEKRLIALVAQKREAFYIENTRNEKGLISVGLDPLFCVDLKGETSPLSLRKIQSLLLRMQYENPLDFEVDFCGGAMGMIYFEYAYQVAGVQSMLRDDDHGFIHFYRDLIIVNKSTKKFYIISYYFPQIEEQAQEQALKRIHQIEEQLIQIELGESLSGEAPFLPMKEEDKFNLNFHLVKEEINKGNLFQCVLSEERSHLVAAKVGEIFTKLKKQNNVPYCYLVQNKEKSYLGASPEFLIKYDGKECVQSAPIAGTRARSEDPIKELKKEQDLLSCPKEAAEHLMLVDLARNDLGRVCRPGSIEVVDYKSLKKFDHVMHLVSLVQGKLDQDKTPLDAFEASYPAGTLSGAPKIEALKNIQKLEGKKRKSYGGSLLFFDFAKKLEAVIAIRCMEIEKGSATYRVGAGIVFDSVDKNEYKELENKARTVERVLSA